MDGSRVTQSLDSLWFYTNILTYTDDPLASLTDQFSPLVHAKELPNTPFLVNEQEESKNVGEISSAFEELRVMSEDYTEMVKSAGGREREKRERRKRRKWNKFGSNGTKVIQQQTKLPPFDDDVAMKQHLKSWAYAVACTVK